MKHISLWMVIIYAVIFIAHAASGQGLTAYSPNPQRRALVETQSYIRYCLQNRPKRLKEAIQYAPVIVHYTKFFSDDLIKIDHLLVSLMIHLESSWKSSAIGFSNGEKGLMQLHGIAARKLDLRKPSQQILGGVRHLRKCYDKCGGNTTHALNCYGTGKCKPVLKFAKRRTRLYAKVLKEFRIDLP